MFTRLNCVCCVCAKPMDWHARYGRNTVCCSAACFREFSWRYALSITGEPYYPDPRPATPPPAGPPPAAPPAAGDPVFVVFENGVGTPDVGWTYNYYASPGTVVEHTPDRTEYGVAVPPRAYPLWFPADRVLRTEAAAAARAVELTAAANAKVGPT